MLQIQAAWFLLISCNFFLKSCDVLQSSSIKVATFTLLSEKYKCLCFVFDCAITRLPYFVKPVLDGFTAIAFFFLLTILLSAHFYPIFPINALPSWLLLCSTDRWFSYQESEIMTQCVFCVFLLGRIPENCIFNSVCGLCCAIKYCGAYYYYYWSYFDIKIVESL